jgi:hypothetical protein
VVTAHYSLTCWVQPEPAPEPDAAAPEAAGGPAGAEPDPTEPDATEADATEPDPTEPDPTEPDPTEPDPTEPDPTEPDPTEPDPTEPDPTESDPTEPDPTEPDPTEPDPTEQAGRAESAGEESALAAGTGEGGRAAAQRVADALDLADLRWEEPWWDGERGLYRLRGTADVADEGLEQAVLGLLYRLGGALTGVLTHAPREVAGSPPTWEMDWSSAAANQRVPGLVALDGGVHVVEDAPGPPVGGPVTAAYQVRAWLTPDSDPAAALTALNRVFTRPITWRPVVLDEDAGTERVDGACEARYPSLANGVLWGLYSADSAVVRYHLHPPDRTADGLELRLTANRDNLLIPALHRLEVTVRYAPA